MGDDHQVTRIKMNGLSPACNGDKAAAVKFFEQAYRAGSVKAARQLATIYMIGDGVEKSWTKSAEWTEKAAAMGDVDSQRAIAHAYETGLGVT